MRTELEINCRGEAMVLELGAAGVPANIQWMPPGRHTVWPDGFEAPFDIEVTARLAEAANAQLQVMRQAAAQGKGNWPYGDFNHEDGEQSFEAVEFFWGGEDPKSGGVRLRVNWSASGEQKVKGKAFRSFSPSWRLHKDTHEFLGIGLNVGGLVNRSAFKFIQAVARGNRAEGLGDPGASEITKAKGGMTENEKTEITNLICGAMKPIADQVGALAKLPERIQALELKVEAKGKEKSPEVVSLEARVKVMEDAGVNVLQANAKRTVEEIGVKAGRIASQDKDTIEWWTKQIAADAKAVDALGKMPVNPAFVQVVQAGASGTTASANGEGSCEFIAKAKEYAKANNLQDELDAQVRFAGTKEGKELYERYQLSLRSK